MFVQPRPDDARVNGDRLHVAVAVEASLERSREHDLRRLRVAVSALGTVELPEIPKSVQTLRSIHFIQLGRKLRNSQETYVNENEVISVVEEKFEKYKLAAGHIPCDTN